MARNRNWRPRGKGFRQIFDHGVTACWMRLEADQTVTCVVYIGSNYGSPFEGIWTLRCRRGAPIFWSIINKPHRVYFVENDDDHWYGCLSYERQPVPQVTRRGPKRRGYRRRPRPMRKNPWTYDQTRYRFRGTQLPRKFR